MLASEKRNSEGEDGGLWGERNILNWFHNLCLTMSNAQIPKLLLLSGMLRSRTLGSDIEREFWSQLRAIVRDEPAGTAFDRLAPLAYRALDDPEEFLIAKEHRLKTAMGEYAEWLANLSFADSQQR